MQLKNMGSLPQRLVIGENPAGKTEAKGNLHGKDSTPKA